MTISEAPARIAAAWSAKPGSWNGKQRVRIFFATALLLTTVGYADPPELVPEVARQLEHQLDNETVRAVVVGLYDDGQTRVIGLGRLSRDDPRVPGGDTVFEIGSISKVFSALLTQRQVAAGRLDWDGAIGSYLTQVQFANAAASAITLRELATHTSGLPRLPNNLKPLDPLDPYADYERRQLLSFLQGFDSALEKKYSYSNLGVGLLAVIAADAVGSSLSRAISQEVLQPLALSDTAVGMPPYLGDRLAVGYSQGADMPNWSFGALAGAGAMVSTVDDLLGFIGRNLESDGLADALAAIRQQQAGGETGLGWHIRDAAEADPVFWHNGGTGGYASFLALRPSNRNGVVMLTTSTAYDTVTALGFSQIMGGGPDRQTIDLEPFAGSYQLAENFVLSIYVEAGKLFGRATGQGAFPLTPAGLDEFVYQPAGVRIVFERSASNRVDKLQLHQGGRLTPAARVSDKQQTVVREVLALEALAARDYVGRYRLTAEVEISVVARDRQVYAQLTGQAAYPIFYFATDRFFYKVVDAELEFERDDRGQVVAVTLHQGGPQRAPRIQ